MSSETGEPFFCFGILKCGCLIDKQEDTLSGAEADFGIKQPAQAEMPADTKPPQQEESSIIKTTTSASEQLNNDK